MAVWFTNRRGGVSEPPYAELNLGLHVGDDPDAVAENRRRLDAVTGGRPVVWMDQVHGRRVAVVDGPYDGAVPETDALVTARPDLVLAVLVADCVPVMLRGPVSEGPTSGTTVVAAAHAGRRGLQLGVVEAVVSRMSSMGVQPKAIVAELGPAVCGKCYEVPASMRDEVAAVAPAARTTARSGRPALDLRAGLVQQLHALGVSRVTVDSTCTFESPQHFSHRRDQRTGRTAGLIVIDS
ncbi:MAG TPA: peptidoglycan editing factor PgeF [Frankiaceae bacterium]|nr:peptidoglycan editing factor PgeF [Frankiaceae bacterium]